MLQHRSNPVDPDLEPLDQPGKTSGFASPAEDYLEGRLNILERLISDPVNTYYAEASTNELLALGISKGTLFVYDTSLRPAHGSLVVLWHGGEWKVRQLLIAGARQYLSTGKETDEPEAVSGELLIRGVVTWSCRPHQLKVKRHVRPGRR